MNQQEIKVYLKNNKTVAFGVPFILGILLLDMLVLKPARMAKKQEAAGVTTAQPANPAAAAVAGTAPAAMPPLKAPDPVVAPVYPQLSPNIDIRFAANMVYPYGSGRNIFIEPAKSEGVVFVTTDESEPAAVVERPDISYHGFFTLGKDKVAILRLADELLLTRVGSTLKRTPFCLTSVFPEKIVISDTTDGVKDFEISLSDKKED